MANITDNLGNSITDNNGDPITDAAPISISNLADQFAGTVIDATKWQQDSRMGDGLYVQPIGAISQNDLAQTSVSGAPGATEFRTRGLWALDDFYISPTIPPAADSTGEQSFYFSWGRPEAHQMILFNNGGFYSQQNINLGRQHLGLIGDGSRVGKTRIRVKYVAGTDSWELYHTTTANDPPLLSDWVLGRTEPRNPLVPLIGYVAFGEWAQTGVFGHATWDGFNGPTAGVVANPLYLGVTARASRYLGIRTDAQMYLGSGHTSVF